MNLDVIFEDLEAQGYFQTNSRSKQQLEATAKQVLVELPHATHLLGSVLIGPDFLSGFEFHKASLRWLVIPINNIQLIRATDNGTELLQTESRLAALLELKLLKQRIQIITTKQVIAGELLSVTDDYLKLQGDTCLWIPLSQLGVVVVENYSDLA